MFSLEILRLKEKSKICSKWKNFLPLDFTIFVTLINHGSGDCTSGRSMMEISLGSNPRTDSGCLQSKIAANLFLLGVGLFLITCKRTA